MSLLLPLPPPALQTGQVEPDQPASSLTNNRISPDIQGYSNKYQRFLHLNIFTEQAIKQLTRGKSTAFLIHFETATGNKEKLSARN